MPTAGWTRLVLILAAGMWAIIAIVGGAQLSWSSTRPLGIVTSAVVLLLLVLDRWAWRWPGFRSALRRPILHGTWRATLQTGFPARAGEEIETYLVVRQTYSCIAVSMLFDRSRSTSTSADIARANGIWMLNYLYLSEKSALEGPDNPNARGAAALVISTTGGHQLAGDYWTEAKTKGRITTTGYSATIFDHFEAARAASYT